MLLEGGGVDAPRSDVEAARTNVVRLLSKEGRQEPLAVIEKLTQRFLALKHIRNLDGAGRTRVHLRTLESMEVEDRTSMKLSRKVYILKKALLPRIPESVPALAILDAAAMAPWPSGVLRDEVWVFDSCVPRDVLGPGILDWTCEMSTSTVHKGGFGSLDEETPSQAHFDLGQTSTPSAPPAATPPPPVPTPPTPTPAPTPTPQVDPTAAAPRLLKQHDSNTDAPEDVPSAELIAQASMDAASRGAFFNSDQNCSDTVEFWMRQFVHYLKVENKRWEKSFSAGPKQAFHEVIDEYAKLYPRWATTMLLDHACFSNLQAMSKHLQVMIDLVPETTSELAKVS